MVGARCQPLHSYLTAGNERYPFTALMSVTCWVKDDGRLFHDDIILDGFDPSDAASDLACLIFVFLIINEAAHLNDAFAGFHADLE